MSQDPHTISEGWDHGCLGHVLASNARGQFWPSGVLILASHLSPVMPAIGDTGVEFSSIAREWRYVPARATCCSDPRRVLIWSCPSGHPPQVQVVGGRRQGLAQGGAGPADGRAGGLPQGHTGLRGRPAHRLRRLPRLQGHHQGVSGQIRRLGGHGARAGGLVRVVGFGVLL